MASSNRILVKLSPTIALAATNSRANLRLLHDEVSQDRGLGLTSTPAWYLADLPDQTGPNPWDLAHAQVADQLGIDESAVLFAEPDLPQHFLEGTETDSVGRPLAAAQDCTPLDQDATHKKVSGPGFA